MRNTRVPTYKSSMRRSSGARGGASILNIVALVPAALFIASTMLG